MIKRLAYISILLLFAARSSFAFKGRIAKAAAYTFTGDSVSETNAPSPPPDTNRIKTVPQNRMDVLGVKKIKEVAKPKHQSKPEKVVAPVDTATANKKAKRQRRPDGLERPPEIPRRNND
jgi:hypothetical protein